jgi:hypothetical protein
MKDISYAWTQGKHRPTHQFLVAILQDGNQISFCRTSFPEKGSGAMRENSTRRPGAHLIPPHQISVLSLSDKSISGNSSRQRLSITYLRWPLAVLWAAKAASLEQRPRRQTEALGVAGGGQNRGSRGGTRELGSQLATGDSAKVSDSAADWRAGLWRVIHLLVPDTCLVLAGSFSVFFFLSSWLLALHFFLQPS